MLLTGLAFEAAGAEGTSEQFMRVVDAGEILAKVQAGQPVEYDHVVVRGDLDLSRERLQKNITSPIRINDSRFGGLVSFNGSTLEMPVDISGSGFTKESYFRGATFQRSTDFGMGHFPSVRRRALAPPISWRQSTTFSGNADFEDVNFSGVALFWGATFSRDANFNRVNFSKDVNFAGATFSRYTNFEDAAFSKDVNYAGTTFSKDAQFNGATFGGNARLDWAAFSGDADFSGATFSKDAYCSRATFYGSAIFRWATFGRFAEFGSTIFRGPTEFRKAIFRREASFVRAIFSDYANFEEAVFNNGASFIGSTFNRDASFIKVYLGGDADFREATLVGDMNLSEAEFEGNLEFGDASFENDTSFYRTLLKRPAYFENCSIKSLNLTKAEYNRLHLRWDDIKSLHFDEAAYLALIKNYNTLGWYGDANRCYYDYRNAVRRSWQAPSSGFAARLSSLLDRLVDFGEWILYGYGVRPSFPIAWSVLIILAFGLFFRQKRCLRKIITEEKIEDAGDGSDEVLVESKARKAPINSLDPFLFSLFTFTSGFTAFLQPAVEYKLERCLRWAIAERLLGPFFLALVITTISKTYLIR